ncbi:SIMPL domain-containing protein [Candidatus Saccharibacteria bacterium]|nr:SIMPL domain-containing protein [Candidatus Saccharibacteria bacterium]
MIKKSSNKVHLIIEVLLLISIGAIVWFWKPWAADTNRTVQVTGQATVEAEPDEYVFFPSYEFDNASNKAALAELTAKNAKVVAGLKKLGVEDSAIKTNADSYDKGIYLPAKDAESSTYSLSLTVTVSDQKLAQKVQDYLVTTTPTGQVSPQADFSDVKRQELESQARSQAEINARGKAEESAKNLGFSLGKVQTITDGTGFGIIPLAERGLAADSATSSSLPVMPGENELTYSVTVTYYIK